MMSTPCGLLSRCLRRLGSAIVITLLAARPALAWDPLQKAQRAAQHGGESLQAGDPTGALEAYLRAQALDPDAPDIRMGVGEALFAEGDFPAAVSQYLGAVDLSDLAVSRPALYNAGNSALAAGELEKALTLYEEAVLLGEPGDDLLHNLELTQKLLEQQQQQQQEQERQDQPPQDENQEQQDPSQEQEQQDQPPPQDEQEQQEQEQQEPQQDEQRQDEPEQEEAPPDSMSVPPPDSTATAMPDSVPPPPEGMTPEEAMRLLEALDHDEEELRRSIQRRLRGTETESEHDW